MDVTYQNKSEVKVFAGSEITIPVPPGFFAGNFLLSIISKDDDVLINENPAWVTLFNIVSSPGCALYVAYRIAQAGDTQWTWTGDAESYLGVILRYIGHDPVTPINISDVAIGIDAAPTAPSVVTTRDGCMIVWAFGADDNDIPYTVPGPPFNQRFNDEATTNGGAGGDWLQSSQGAAGAGVFGMAAVEEWVAVTVAIQPAIPVTQTKPYTLAGKLIKRSTKPYSLAGRLFKKQIKTYTLAARLLKTLTKTYSLAAWLSKSFTKTYTLAAKLVSRELKTYSITGRLIAQKVKTYSLTARLIKSAIKTYTTGARLKKLQIQTYALAARLIKRITKTYALAAKLVKVATATYTLAALLSKTQIKTCTLNARLLKPDTATYTIGAYIITWESYQILKIYNRLDGIDSKVNNLSKAHFRL